MILSRTNTSVARSEPDNKTSGTGKRRASPRVAALRWGPPGGRGGLVGGGERDAPSPPPLQGKQLNGGGTGNNADLSDSRTFVGHLQASVSDYEDTSPGSTRGLGRPPPAPQADPHADPHAMGHCAFSKTNVFLGK